MSQPPPDIKEVESGLIASGIGWEGGVSLLYKWDFEYVL
jgi:hypothetical protein